MGSLTARWRQTVAAYHTYSQAQTAVDTLVRRGFPAGDLSIVAEDLRFTRALTDRRKYSKAAVGGAVSAAVAVSLSPHGVVFGTLVGTALATIVHRLSFPRRSATWRDSVEADRYVVVCDGETADEAAAILRSAWKH